MQNGLYVSLSAQVALERRLETIADNVANMNTVGYRATGVSFEKEMAKAGDAKLSYVSNGSDFISRRLGGLIKTDNSLDFAVQGDGWFGIQTPQGVAYTRDGRAQIDESGMLRTLNGDPILDAGGAPILLDSEAGPLAVSADGMITQNGRQVGAIGLFAIAPDASLKRAENSSVVPDKPATPVLDFTRDGVVQGAVEGSNVDPVREMTRLIEVTRVRWSGGRNFAIRDVAARRDQGSGSVRMIDISSDTLPPLERLEHRVAQGLRTLPLAQVSGAVVEVSMSHYRVAGLSHFLKLGESVGVDVGGRVEIGEVVRIDDSSAVLKPFDARSEVTIGARAFRTEALSLSPHRAWKGRVIDALGRPIDGAGELVCGERPAPLDASPPPPLKRARVHAPLRTGVRVVDLFTPLCVGQRVGVFAGSGVGKSSLLAMLARATPIDTVVIALVGERGREVREFLDDTLGENRSSAVAVVSTGDESPMMRRLAPKTAMAVAEYFRDQGESVLLIVDSVTRYAHASRDVALAAGEPAVARGYAPSVFSDLPRLLERAGPGLEGSGSITGIFSVLVDGDDHNDPVADAIRGTLDGHIVLDRAIADEGRYPAVNILSSVSRMTNPLWRPEQRKVVQNLRAMIARYEETRELRLMGGYTAGADSTLDKAIKSTPRIYEAMNQTMEAPKCDDPFIDLAAALRNESKPVEA